MIKQHKFSDQLRKMADEIDSGLIVVKEIEVSIGDALTISTSEKTTYEHCLRIVTIRDGR